MSPQDRDLIAAALRGAAAGMESRVARAVVDFAAASIADALVQKYPNFDRARFILDARAP